MNYCYPALIKPFNIYKYTISDYHLGATIIQDNRPVLYRSKKLTYLQNNYNTIEKKLLAIVLCIKEKNNMLYG